MHYYVYALVCMYVYIIYLALVYMSHYLGFPWAVGAPFVIPLGPHYRGVRSTGSTGAGAPLEISLCTYITQLITYTHDRLYT